MKTNRLKKGIYWLILSLIAVPGLSQTGFAKSDFIKGGSAEVVFDNGKFGLARVPMPGGKPKEITKAKKHADAILPETDPTVIVYASYTSYTIVYGHDTYWPWICPECAYLFVAFRVTDNTKVKIRWVVEGPDEFEDSWIFTDSEEVDGKLDPDFWYYAWLQPETLSVGLYDYHSRVKPYPGPGTVGYDRCKFEAIEEE